jgi:hypothetical protein
MTDELIIEVLVQGLPKSQSVVDKVDTVIVGAVEAEG